MSQEKILVKKYFCTKDRQLSLHAIHFFCVCVSGSVASTVSLLFFFPSRLPSLSSFSSVSVCVFYLMNLHASGVHTSIQTWDQKYTSVDLHVVCIITGGNARGRRQSK